MQRDKGILDMSQRRNATEALLIRERNLHHFVFRFFRARHRGSLRVEASTILYSEHHRRTAIVWGSIARQAKWRIGHHAKESESPASNRNTATYSFFVGRNGLP